MADSSVQNSENFSDRLNAEYANILLMYLPFIEEMREKSTGTSIELRWKLLRDSIVKPKKELTFEMLQQVQQMLGDLKVKEESKFRHRICEPSFISNKEMTVSCAICYCSYETDQEVEAVECGHTFHKICLLKWKNSSQQMTCPECRTEYSSRTIKKLYLNIKPKDQAEVNDNLNEKLVQQTSIADELKVELQRIQLEKNEMECRLMKSQDECRTLLADNEALKTEYENKCQAYSRIKEINDQSLKKNDHQKGKNRGLKRRVEQRQKVLKTLHLKTSKTLIDLTADDQEADSDLEIIETENLAKKPRMNPPENVADGIGLYNEPELLNDPETVEPEPAMVYATEEMQNPAPSELDLQTGLWHWPRFLKRARKYKSFWSWWAPEPNT